MRVVKKVQWEPAVTERQHFSVLKLCTSQRHTPHALKLSSPNCGNSEESLSSVILDGSNENIVNSITCKDSEIDLGSKRFWISLRINLPPKRPINVKAVC